MNKEINAEKYIAKKYKLKLMDLDFFPYDTWILDSEILEKRYYNKVVEFLKKYNNGKKQFYEEWEELFNNFEEEKENV